MQSKEAAFTSSLVDGGVSQHFSLVLFYDLEETRII